MARLRNKALEIEQQIRNLETGRSIAVELTAYQINQGVIGAFLATMFENDEIGNFENQFSYEIPTDQVKRSSNDQIFLITFTRILGQNEGE